MPQTQKVFQFIVKPKSSEDPRSNGYLADAHALGFVKIKKITCCDLYFIQGNLNSDEIEALSSQVLHDPVSESIQVHDFNNHNTNNSVNESFIIDVSLLPGVTDPVAEQIVRSAGLLGIKSLKAASTGFRFEITGANSDESLYHDLALKLLSNPVIQRYELGEIEPVFPIAAEAEQHIEKIIVRGKSDQELLKISEDRRAALDIHEMKAIQAYCETEKRDLTDVEFEMIAQTWSEHCVHKTFKAKVNVDIENEPENNYQIDNLFKETVRKATAEINAPWVRTAFIDNAGMIDFDEENEVSFKVETHNHPSAIEPFGGANTGIGGVIRDILGVSAKPIAATDVLCFGPQNADFEDIPKGVLHPRRISAGVVAGIQDYGNKIGIPTVSGAIYYDPGYTANPLVYCGCAGIAPKESHPRTPHNGDHIIVLGGRTGRDGLRGATFSSMTMDAQTGTVSGASVQIGAPIVEKGLIDVVVLARDEKLYNAITDCGAGGLSSAVGEMSSKSGAEIQLADVPLKYPGLAPWEIWLSEAQERMVLAVPENNLERLQALCDRYDVNLTDIGQFNDLGRIQGFYQDNLILDLNNDFLHDGIPQRELNAKIIKPEPKAGFCIEDKTLPELDCEQTLLDLLAHPNIATKEAIIRIYDHEVQGGTVVKPLTGVRHDGPSDAVVVKPIGTKGSRAIVLSAGMNPEFGKLDAWQMSMNVIDEAVRNAVAVGADPDRIAILDNFCWGDPNRPEILGSFVEAARGCYDGAKYFATPFISGKDSFNNEYTGTDGLRHAIPPTLLISAMGIMDNWDHAVTLDLKQAGNPIYLIGAMKPTFGGSHFNLTRKDARQIITEGVPTLDEQTRDIYRTYHEALNRKLVKSSHDLSEGGLSVAAAEMCIAGRTGMHILLNNENAVRWLFAETTGCLLVEVDRNNEKTFESMFSGQYIHKIGSVSENPVFRVQTGDKDLIHIDLDTLVKTWKTN